MGGLFEGGDGFSGSRIQMLHVAGGCEGLLVSGRSNLGLSCVKVYIGELCWGRIRQAKLCNPRVFLCCINFTRPNGFASASVGWATIWIYSSLILPSKTRSHTYEMIVNLYVFGASMKNFVVRKLYFSLVITANCDAQANRWNRCNLYADLWQWWLEFV